MQNKKTRIWQAYSHDVAILAEEVEDLLAVHLFRVQTVDHEHSTLHSHSCAHPSRRFTRTTTSHKNKHENT